jgi:hypothetical protein
VLRAQWPGTVSIWRFCSHGGAYLVLGLEVVQLVCPLDQQHSDLCIPVGLVHVLPHFRIPPRLHLLGALLVFDILRAWVGLLDQLRAGLLWTRDIEVVVDAVHANVGVDDLVLEWVVVGTACCDAALHGVYQVRRHVGKRHGCSGRAQGYKAESVRSRHHSDQSSSLHQPSCGPQMRDKQHEPGVRTLADARRPANIAPTRGPRPTCLGAEVEHPPSEHHFPTKRNPSGALCVRPMTDVASHFGCQRRRALSDGAAVCAAKR